MGITSGPKIWNELPNTCYLNNENMLQMTKLYKKEILQATPIVENQYCSTHHTGI